MAATTHTCLVIVCDVCGYEWQGDSVYHWVSLDDARGFAAQDGWYLTANGAAICDSTSPDHDRKTRELLPALAENDRHAMTSARPWLENQDSQEH